jgi:hypothetical protein
MFLIFMFGLVFAIANLSRHPSAAGLAALGILLLLGTMVFATGFNFWLYDLGGYESFGNQYAISITGFMRAVIEATATAMLILAVFVGRGVKAPPLPTQFAAPVRA